MKLAAAMAAVAAITAPIVAHGVPQAPATLAAGPSSEGPRILVIPFENVARDSHLFWIGEAAAVLLADALNSLGASAFTREERLQAFDHLQVPPTATLSDATIIRIGQLVGARDVVVGTYRLDRGRLVVSARVVVLEVGRVEPVIQEEGTADDLFPIFERLAGHIAPPTASGNEPGALRPPSMPVFENYIKGLLAETPDSAVGFFITALTLQPSFDQARLALWDVYADEGDFASALAEVMQVTPKSPWAEHARFLAATAELNLKRYDEAFMTFRTLAEQHETAPVLNDLGVVQLRRGGSPPGNDAPAAYFKRAADADPDDPDYVFNLGYAYALAHDPQAAIRWLRETVRRNPADGDAHDVLAAALAATGDSVEAAREKELARRLSSVYGDAKREGAGGGGVPPGLERLKSDVELPRVRHIDSLLAAAEQRDQRGLAEFYLAQGRRLFEQHNDREASAELNRAIYLSPYQAEAHLLLGRLRLRDGQVREAIAALKISVWSAETVEAHVALADAYLQTKDTAAARVEVDRALALDPASPDAKRLLERLGPP